MTEILLGPDVTVELALLDDDQRAKHPLLTTALRVWSYVGAMDAVHRSLIEQLGTSQAASAALDGLRSRLNWQSALSEDTDCGDTAPLTYGLSKAVARLGEEARLVTRDPHLLDEITQAVAPGELGTALTDDRPLGFLDLATQQDQLRDEIERRMFAVMRSGQYILGKEVVELETRLAEFTEVDHCVAVSSGTDSLVIAMMALGIGPGDEVITTPYTWISSAEAILLVGAKPVFVDVDSKTFNMDPDQLESAITSSTKAIMPVSLYGQCSDMPTINEIADRHGVPVIEDAAQSLGATCDGRPSCGQSTIGSASFFPTKPLGCYGDGGALFTSDAELAGRMKQIRAHGQLKKHHHPIVGMNGRLDTLQAAVLLAKIDSFGQECSRRALVASRYDKMISQRLPLVKTPHVPSQNTSVYAQYTLCVENRDAVQSELKSRGVPSVAYYIVPLTLQPVMAHLGYKAGDFPISEHTASRCLSLPMSPFLSVEAQERIVQALVDSVAATGSSVSAAA